MIATELRVTTRSEQQTERLGALLAGELSPGDIVLLSGELGAGKTTLVRGIAAGLGFDGDVTSPTFTLLHHYPGRLLLLHADLWRLERLSEIEDLALDDELAAGAVLVAEWGEAAEPLFSGRALAVRIGIDQGELRHFEIDASAPGWAECAAGLSHVLGRPLS
ncbi:MAG: tRNA (adenosine(37)-N6)-threonylcarbamoyltransferase complex ATPase subunit type 1 TsaE [Acidimicrobiales bacterium]